MGNEHAALDAAAYSPRVLHRLTPMSFKVLRRACRMAGVACRPVFGGLVRGFKEVEGVKWVWRLSPSLIVVVWKQSYATRELWKHELKLKECLDASMPQLLFPTRRQLSS